MSRRCRRLFCVMEMIKSNYVFFSLCVFLIILMRFNNEVSRSTLFGGKGW